MRFVDDDDAADAKAQRVLEGIANKVGFKDVAFVYEPIAAAYHYEETAPKEEIVLIAVIAVLWIVLAVSTPAFLTAGSIQPLLVSTAPIAVAGVGMTIVIITGGIDVSVGAAITQECIVRKDEAEDEDRRASPLVEFVARMPRRLGYHLGP